MNNTIPSLERYRQICYKKSLFIFFLFFYDFSFFSLLLFLLPFSACSLSSVIPSSLFLLLSYPASSTLLFFFFFFFSFTFVCSFYYYFVSHFLFEQKPNWSIVVSNLSPFLFSFFFFSFFFSFFSFFRQFLCASFSLFYLFIFPDTISLSLSFCFFRRLDHCH